MSRYTPPLKDIQFVLKELAGLEGVLALPGYEDTDEDLTQAILEEAGKFASGVLAPINFSGDQEGCSWEQGVVSTPAGFKDAYLKYV